MKPNLFSGRIQNCYDSHVHWRATGSVARKILLHHLRSQQDVLSLKLEESQKNGEWYVGFGWDHNLFTETTFPTREVLDKKFPDHPVYFVRADGHAAWVNTRALQLAGLFDSDNKNISGGQILRGQDGLPTGVLIDLAMNCVSQLLPKDSPANAQKDLLLAQNIFHQAGFTHIRDLTCDELQWQATLDLVNAGKLKLAIEQFVNADRPQDFKEALRFAKWIKDTAPKQVRVKGVKVFYDGALGSEGALLSKAYLSGSGFGLQLMTPAQLKDIMLACFKENLDLAVHAIGDEAAHQIAQTAFELREKIQGPTLHIEHAELLRPETIKLLAQVKVECHMQPCHYLSDRRWLRQKIGDLTEHAFRWADLERANIHFDFGSDTPIEPTSVQNNIRAIDVSAEDGILPPQKSAFAIHAHRDLSWCANSYTDFSHGQVSAIHFLGEKI